MQDCYKSQKFNGKRRQWTSSPSSQEQETEPQGLFYLDLFSELFDSLKPQGHRKRKKKEKAGDIVRWGNWWFTWTWARSAWTWRPWTLSINADGHWEKLTLCLLLSAVIKFVFVANWFNAIVPDNVSQTSLGGKSDFHDHLRQRGDVRFSWGEQTLIFFPGATHLPEQNSRILVLLWIWRKLNFSAMQHVNRQYQLLQMLLGGVQECLILWKLPLCCCL